MKAVTKGMKQNRCSSWRAWIAFCKYATMPVFIGPGKKRVRTSDGYMTQAQSQARMFVAYLRRVRDVQGSTVKEYLLKVLQTHERAGYPLPFTIRDFHVVEAIQGAETEKPSGRNVKDGFEDEHMCALFATSGFDPGTAHGMRNRAVASAARASTMRSEMYSSNNSSREPFDATHDAAGVDLRVFRYKDFGWCMSVFIPTQKSDKAMGVEKVVASCPENKFCPVRWNRAYFMKHRQGAQPLDPLYIDHNSGKQLSYHAWRRVLVRACREAGLNSRLYGTHSFRRGGTSSGCASGLRKRIVQALGPWKSGLDGAADALIFRIWNQCSVHHRG